jgi:SAM-dependent methyltransferase
MKRLNKENTNTSTSYIQKPPDWFDLERLTKLMRFYTGGALLDLGSYDSRLKEVVRRFKSIIPIACWSKEYDWVPEVLPEEDNIYDYVVMGQLLEHLEEPEKYLKEAVRVLKPGGILALSVPLNETKAGEVDGEGHHLWSFSEQDIIDLIKPYGPYEIEILRSQYIPSYRYHFPHIIAFVKKQ